MATKEVKSEITGAVWKIVKQPGDLLGDEDAIMILESMKMEIPVLAEANGTLVELTVKEGEPVTEGQLLAVLDV